MGRTMVEWSARAKRPLLILHFGSCWERLTAGDIEVIGEDKMSRKIIFYDVASKLTPQAWSPNCWKARYVLNYKGLPYETVYVSYPDISNLWKELGLSPLAGPGPKTTLPLISVQSADGGPPSVIADSFNIALFLDHEFPDSPIVIPPNTAALQASWVFTLGALLPGSFAPLLVPTVVPKLDDPGAVYFRETREKAFGMKLEELAPPGEKRDAAIEKMKHNLSSLNNMLHANGGHEENSREWVMGSLGPTFADFALGGMLIWFKLVGDPEVWPIIAAWNGGRWSRHLDQLEPWTDNP